MNRFNTLTHGDPAAVVSELADQPADEQELRCALQNAFQRIERLEQRLRDTEDGIITHTRAIAALGAAPGSIPRRTYR